MSFVSTETHKIRVFRSEIIAPSGSTFSRWIKLNRSYTGHGVNGRVAGLGTLTLSYYLSSTPLMTDADAQGNIVTGVTDGGADDPFVKTVAIRPSNYIRFLATETSANFITLTLTFTQVG